MIASIVANETIRCMKIFYAGNFHTSNTFISNYKSYRKLWQSIQTITHLIRSLKKSVKTHCASTAGVRLLQGKIAVTHFLYQH